MKIAFNNIYNVLMMTILGLAIISCGSNDQEVSEEHHAENNNSVELTQEQFEQASIKIGRMERRIIGSELRVNGIIDVPPQSNISINMPYGGFIKYTDILPGTHVKKGQLLAVIENPEFIQFQQDYLEGLVNKEYLKSEYERQEKLYSENVASGKSFQQAKSNYLANEARINSMEARLMLIGYSLNKIKEGKISASVNIYAPVSGSVRAVYTNIGKYIDPKDVIMEITNADDLHVELTVYENDIPTIKAGQRIRFSLANAPEVWREAEVFLVGSGVREDRSVTVHGHLKKIYKDLLPGMYVSAKIETDSHEVLAVPEKAVVRYGGKHYVYKYSGQRSENGKSMHDFEMVEITKGYSEDGYIQISLLSESDDLNSLKFVTSGAFTLLAKAKNTEEEGGGHGH